MRKITMRLCGGMAALAVLACLTTAQARGEQGDEKLRKEALKLNEITGTEARKGEEEKLLKDKSAAKKLVAEAARMAAEKPQPFTYNATYILGGVAFELKDYRASETFFRIHLDQAKQLRSVKGLMPAYRGLVFSFYNRRKYAQAERIAAEAVESETIQGALQNLIGDKDKAEEFKNIVYFRFSMVEFQVNSIAFQGDAERAVKVIDRAFGEKADDWAGLELKGNAYRIAGKNEDAIKAYEDEIQRLKEDNDLKKKDKEYEIDKVRYHQSGIYIELDQADKAIEILKQLQTKHPDDPNYNNDLGYVMADHDMNLEEAEKMVRKALEEDRKETQKKNPKRKPEEIKDRGSYLDSLGWILYKQKKYVEAKRYLRQAVQNTIDLDETESIEIYDHLGDVLLALGQKAEAVDAWKKGMAVAGDTKREKKRKEAVQKKIKTNE